MLSPWHDVIRILFEKKNHVYEIAKRWNYNGGVAHIRISKLTIIGSGNGLAAAQLQTVILTNDGIWLIWPLGANFS